MNIMNNTTIICICFVVLIFSLVGFAFAVLDFKNNNNPDLKSISIGIVIWSVLIMVSLYLIYIYM